MTEPTWEHICLVAAAFKIESAARRLRRVEDATGALKIGLIDGIQLRRESLTAALESIHQGLTITSFVSVSDCIARAPHDLDTIIYQPDTVTPLKTLVMDDVVLIHGALPEIPVIVFFEVEELRRPGMLRALLNSGARGFVPTKATGVRLAMTAVRFVLAGGIFVPLELLLTDRLDGNPAPQDAAWQARLSSWEIVILFHLQQGKTNQVIAGEINITEEAVRSHVRNIMRKMGITKRSQVAYEAQKLWARAEIADV